MNNSVHTSTSAATPKANKGATQELLDDQLSDWWLTTVLGDTAFTSDDSESSLGWEFAMEEPVESHPNSESPNEEPQVFCFVTSSSHEKNNNNNNKQVDHEQTGEN